jgi:hypothetical protein
MKMELVIEHLMVIQEEMKAHQERMVAIQEEFEAKLEA